MKGIRYGTMKRRFDILPTLEIRRFAAFNGTTKFDICLSWLCFYAHTNNYGKDCMAKMEKMHAEFRATYNIK